MTGEEWQELAARGHWHKINKYMLSDADKIELLKILLPGAGQPEPFVCRCKGVGVGEPRPVAVIGKPKSVLLVAARLCSHTRNPEWGMAFLRLVAQMATELKEREIGRPTVW